jgi:UDP-N-acetylmuramoyl-L-alanyl-D-glutamate--2,6-diaminopimelate ligase
MDAANRLYHSFSGRTPGMNSPTLTLHQLLPGSTAGQHWIDDASANGAGQVIVTGVTSDSRRVTPGDVFVAVAGTKADGHQFVQQAVARGAVAVVSETPSEGISVPQYITDCSAAAFARMCMRFNVGTRCPIVCAGITGTNGKTTASWMLRSILQTAGLRTGMVGTIECDDGVECSASEMTTPTADALAAHMRRLMEQRATHSVLEISSHALVQKRCAGIQLSAAAITNITQDHFDYHRTVDAYRMAKASIAELLHADAPLLLNLDDPGCQYVMDRLVGSAAVITFGVDNPEAELRSTLLQKNHRSQRVRLELAQGDAEIRLRMIGRHNVANCLVAAGLAEQLGVRLSHIVDGLESLHVVPGRLERIDEGQSFQVLVDYAHTPDALARCTSTIRDFVPGRLICVFGAGGDRDQSKRPRMGEAASIADYCIITSDNPRNEDPQTIAEQIAEGFSTNTEYDIQLDRREAIAHAFDVAQPGDVVLLAGKGHESVQEIGSEQYQFDDRDVARSLLREMTASQTVAELQPRFSLPKSA